MSTVIHPKHYNSHPSGVECWDVGEHLSFCLGSALKYLWRLNCHSNPQEQLDKAINYLEKEIVRIQEYGGRSNIDTTKWNSFVVPTLLKVRSFCNADSDPLGILIDEILGRERFYDDNLVTAVRKLKTHRQKFYGADNASP